MADELIPCPRCGLPSDLTLEMDDALMHAKCVAGHDHALAPSVLEHLRSLAQGAPDAS